MNAKTQDLFRYFYDCYRLDNRQLNIFDFLDRKIEDKVFFSGHEELVSGEFPITPIDNTQASNIVKKLKIYEKEKELIYGCFFIIGEQTDIQGTKSRLCAPLFYYQADIQIKNENYFLSIRSEDRRLNLPLIHLLSRNTNNEFLTDPLFNQLSKNHIQFGDLGILKKLFEKHFPNVNLSDIYTYPHNADKKRITHALKQLPSSEYTYELISSSILGLIEKSENTRGILNELEDLCSIDTYSKPLKEIFEGHATSNQKETISKSVISSLLLSDSQEKLVQSSLKNSLTTIIGPPGTGKTYTIGAIALEHLMRGESVLIVSQSNEAVDVIYNKITSSLKIDKCLIRTGKKRLYSTHLNRHLTSLLTRVYPLKYLLKELGLSHKDTSETIADKCIQLSTSVQKRHKVIVQKEKDFEKEILNELNWGKELSKDGSGLIARLKNKYIHIRNTLQTPLHESARNIFLHDKAQLEDILKLTRNQYAMRVNEVLEQNWNDVKLFSEALKTTSDTERIESFNNLDFDSILKAFPIWLCRLTELKNAIPFRKELFDVVIIDEATQCDISSCLPAIQRAKRVVITGDQNQLRHISFLSKNIQTNLINKYNLHSFPSDKLNYRDKSILDLILNSITHKSQVSTLDEHFRSSPNIIAFSNKYIYDNQLRIMTHRPEQRIDDLSFIECSGVRNANGENLIEGHHIIQDIQQLIANEIDLSSSLSTTIGILSPFRSQTDMLVKLTTESFTPNEIEKHKIRVGTAHNFQGEERDNMYLSFAIDHNSHHSAIHHINKPDVFNVSITRAKEKQFIYHSINTKNLVKDSLLYLFLSQKKQTQLYPSKTHHKDQFLIETMQLLKSWEFNNIYPDFSVAGITIDLLVKRNNTYIGIDLIGYPGAFEDGVNINSYRVLHRANINIIPIPYSNWHFEKQKTQNLLRTELLY